jgi:hypothetical protein
LIRASAGLQALMVGTLLHACATRPPPDAPRPLGHAARLFEGAAELSISHAYQPHGPDELTLWVEMEEVGGGTLGEVEVSVAVDRFEVLDGDTRWIARVPPRGSDRHPLRLRAPGPGLSTVRISLRHTSAAEQTSTSVIHFRIHAKEPVRPCQAGDDECRGALE